MSDIASPLARSKGKIVFLNADGVEVPAGSPDAVTVRTEGFELLRNGAFKIAATYHHPNPPPPSKRRCKTINGKLPRRTPGRLHPMMMRLSRSATPSASSRVSILLKIRPLDFIPLNI